jgi:uncharacterized protein (DUF58 family)
VSTPAARLFPLLNQLLRGSGSESGPILLDRRRIFILPTRFGLIFGVFLLAMLIGSINYSLSLGYVLTFLLGGIALIGILHTYKNLDGLKAAAAGASPAFAGQAAAFHFAFESPHPRFSLAISQGKSVPILFDVEGNEHISVNVPTLQRGRLRPGRFTLSTVYPLGLFRAWSYLQFQHAAIVYPEPAGMPLETAAVGKAGSSLQPSQREGSEDFAGLRNWHPGDSPRQVAWKVAARSEVLSTKRFSDIEGGTVLLDWKTLAGLDTEARLSQLTRWVLDAEQAGLRYALLIPGTSIQTGSGALHQRQCLEALALFALTEHD